AWFLATNAEPKFRNPALAVELARKAVEEAPANADFRQTLGVAHYRTGDWKAAVAALQESVRLAKGGGCHDWLFLAMAHWQMGDKGEARKWYRRASEWVQANEAALAKDKTYAEELRRVLAEATALMGKGPEGKEPMP